MMEIFALQSVIMMMIELHEYFNIVFLEFAKASAIYKEIFQPLVHSVSPCTSSFFYTVK